MCWIGINKPQIATEDIKVFKIFKYDNNELYSPIMRMQWKKGELAPYVCIKESKAYVRYIDAGYHSCRSLKIRTSYMERRFVLPDNTLVMFKKDRSIMLACIIPKGTKYYENEHGEIVSETIKIV